VFYLPPNKKGLTIYQWDVQVTGPAGVVRVLRWPVYDEPTVVGSRVFLFPGEQQEVRQLVIQRLDRKSFETMKLPADCDPYFGSPSVSPCGTMLAHYACRDDSRDAAIRVRRIESDWPVLAESGWIETAGTDVPPAAPKWQGKRRVTGDLHFFHQTTSDELTVKLGGA
jgi:hypothetical protein